MSIARSSTGTAMTASFLGLLSLTAIAEGWAGGGIGRLGGSGSPQLPLAFAGGLTLPGKHGFLGGLHSFCSMQGWRRGGAVLGQVKMRKSEDGEESGQLPILLVKPSERCAPGV